VCIYLLIIHISLYISTYVSALLCVLRFLCCSSSCEFRFVVSCSLCCVPFFFLPIARFVVCFPVCCLLFALFCVVCSGLMWSAVLLGISVAWCLLFVWLWCSCCCIVRVRVLLSWRIVVFVFRFCFVRVCVLFGLVYFWFSYFFCFESPSFWFRALWCIARSGVLFGLVCSTSCAGRFHVSLSMVLRLLTVLRSLLSCAVRFRQQFAFDLVCFWICPLVRFAVLFALL
jgi:hypothetical protein